MRETDVKGKIKAAKAKTEQCIAALVDSHNRLAENIFNIAGSTDESTVLGYLENQDFREKVIRATYGSYEKAEKECSAYWDLEGQLLTITYDALDSLSTQLPAELDSMLRPLIEQVMPSREQAAKIPKMGLESELRQLKRIFQK